MSIRIGNAPLFQTGDSVFSAISNRSNVFNFNNIDNTNVFLNIGQFTTGQMSNIAEQTSAYVIRKGTDMIASFSDRTISLYKSITSLSNIELNSDLYTFSNLLARRIGTSNLSIINENSNSVLISGQSNGFDCFKITNENNGSMYLGGSLGIGTLPISHYSIYAHSNVYIKKNLIADTICTRSLTFDSSNIGGLYFTSSNILIDADAVLVRNLALLGLSKFQDILITNSLVSEGLTLCSNLVLVNARNTYPLRIREKLIPNTTDFVPSFANPIFVTSEYPGLGESSILQLTARGHLLFGVAPRNIDYLMRGDINDRHSYFSGFAHFTTSNYGETFTISDKNRIGIGKQYPSALVDIVNGFTGSEIYYTKPNAFISLSNVYSTNTVPYISCILPNNKRRFSVSSNGSVYFDENPIDIYKYDIESKGVSRFQELDVSVFTSNVIDCSLSTLSNIGEMYVNFMKSERSVMSNVLIYDLEAKSFITNSLDCIDDINDGHELRVLTDRTLFLSSNVVFHPNRYYYTCNEQHFTLPTTDNIRIYTNGTATSTVNAMTTIALNQEAIFKYKNINGIDGAKFSQEFDVNDNKFKIGVINTSVEPNTDARFYITPVNIGEDTITDGTASINIYKDRSIRFGNTTYLEKQGYLSIGGGSLQNEHRLYIKGSMAVRTSTTEAPSLSISQNSPYVGINTTLPTYNLHSEGTLMFSSNRQPQMVIQGNVGIGTHIASRPFHVHFDSYFEKPTIFSSNVVIYGRLDTLGNVASTSDISLKKDLYKIPNALDKVSMLNGYNYTRIDTDHIETGLVAQEVVKVLPEAVTIGPNGLYTLAYGNLAGLFVEAIKELREENIRLREELATLKNHIFS